MKLLNSPGRFRPEGFDVAVVALSARALAASARRAGLSALAIDLFADADTREHAALAVRSPANRRGPGFDGRWLLEVLATHAPEGLPVVLGAAFEHAPALMRAIARRNPIAGASAETVALLKDPWSFAALLRDIDVPHPLIIEDAAPTAIYLSKRVGASGGAHIRPAGRVGTSSRRYLQAFVPGRPISALFLANGRACLILGFSEQWTDPTPKTPFRYGGAAGPIDLDATLAASIAAALDRIVPATGLAGLASADLILTEAGGFTLLEINPRPGATLDVFDRAPLPSLLGLHLDGCAGRLPDMLPTPRAARAAAIVYADRPTSLASLRRPIWTADWTACDDIISFGAPICTIVAAGPSAPAARALVETRKKATLAAMLRAIPDVVLHKNKKEASA